jgi:hypothetical protein
VVGLKKGKGEEGQDINGQYSKVFLVQVLDNFHEVRNFAEEAVYQYNLDK